MKWPDSGETRKVCSASRRAFKARSCPALIIPLHVQSQFRLGLLAPLFMEEFTIIVIVIGLGLPALRPAL